MVKNGSSNPISRREFARKSMIAVAGIGTISLAGYGFYNKKKLRSLNNILRMGHCAPSVMQTLTELNDINNSNLVLYAGAMAGGIAGSDMECGALTAPLMFLSSQQKAVASVEERLSIIFKSQQYTHEFTDYNHSDICRIISGKGFSSCLKAVCGFHQPFSRAISSPLNLSDEAKRSYSRLLLAFDQEKFHCAKSVLQHMNGKILLTNELLDASWIFIGGIAFQGRTCGALAGGVIALGAATAKPENSYARVAKMNWYLTHNRISEALDESTNHFNKSIRLSDELGSWFRSEFGSTSCSGIWGYDFSRDKDSESFITGCCMKQCKYIADKVADRVSVLI